MGRLIDADKLSAVIHRAYSDDLEILDKIDEAETVEAIPISWIKAQMEELKSAGCLGEIGAAGIKALLIQWKEEQEG